MQNNSNFLNRRMANVAGCALLLSASALALTPSNAASGPKSGMYDQVETIVTPRVTMKTSSRLTFKGNKFRIEATSPQDFVPYIDIVDGQSLYHFVPLAKEAARNDLPKASLSPIEVLQQETQRILQTAVKTGQTAVGDINCIAYTLTFPDGGKGTFYQDTDPKFPFFIKEVIVHPERQMTDTTTFENIKLDVPVADTEFTLPTGTKIDQAPPPSAAASGDGSAPGGATVAPGAASAPAGPNAAPTGTAPAAGGG